jgi:hypothetical protein
MHDLNGWAVIVAAASSFLLGGLWYSPAMFGRLWSREAKIGKEPGAGHPARVFGLSFLFALGSAAVFAGWVGPDPTLPDALTCGLLAGAGFVAASFGINYQFANRSTLMWLIDGGYHTVQFLLFGLVLGLWP